MTTMDGSELGLSIDWEPQWFEEAKSQVQEWTSDVENYFQNQFKPKAVDALVKAGYSRQKAKKIVEKKSKEIEKKGFKTVWNEIMKLVSNKEMEQVAKETDAGWSAPDLNTPEAVKNVMESQTGRYIVYGTAGLIGIYILYRVLR